jgi:hypothetical protein
LTEGNVVGLEKQETRVQIDDKLKILIKELGDAINGALSQSAEINDAIQNVKNAGYDVVLALEATIGFNKKSPDGSPGEAETSEDGKLKITSQDLRFLQSLKISIEDINDR